MVAISYNVALDFEIYFAVCFWLPVLILTALITIDHTREHCRSG